MESGYASSSEQENSIKDRISEINNHEEQDEETTDVNEDVKDADDTPVDLDGTPEQYVPNMFEDSSQLVLFKRQSVSEFLSPVQYEVFQTMPGRDRLAGGNVTLRKRSGRLSGPLDKKIDDQDPAEPGNLDKTEGNNNEENKEFVKIHSKVQQAVRTTGPKKRTRKLLGQHISVTRYNS